MLMLFEFIAVCSKLTWAVLAASRQVIGNWL